jgi:hypothetical protein
MSVPPTLTLPQSAVTPIPASSSTQRAISSPSGLRLSRSWLPEQTITFVRVTSSSR